MKVISGKPPFHAIKKEAAVIIALFEGATPQRPPQASEMMWECCRECFKQNPEDRITADILLLRLRALAEFEVTDEGSPGTLPPQEPQREQAPAISTSYEGYSV
ncbi:hypothetical protein EXIGLDRAFT_844828 [Exidia glandulosa HHB12029]|uniref:Serine-threonine/tyrosine-protein kinase catalytic domain-containing protein n=1 Tax=Exidia glandulosa HHB12029 TaxID=1314781 RepID=A0A165BSS2_EXIGL|nr:hypothetical protein EXIGLDRAFT_844828 [Exidia glandulosa HHB12029]